MRFIVALVQLAFILSVASPGLANEDTFSDDDDSFYGLDIESFGHGHMSESFSECLSGCPTRLLTHTVTMYEAWDSSIVTGGDRTNIVFRFDTLSGHGTAYNRNVVLGLNDDGSLYARMVKTRGEYRTLGFVRVWRTDDRTVTIAFPWKSLMKSRASYSWEVDTYYQEDGTECISGADCVDDGTRVRHKLN